MFFLVAPAAHDGLNALPHLAAMGTYPALSASTAFSRVEFRLCAHLLAHHQDAQLRQAPADEKQPTLDVPGGLAKPRPPPALPTLRTFL